MDITAERQGNMGYTGPLSSLQAATAQVTLEKLTRWQVAIDARLQTQMSLLEVLEEYLLVELRTHYYQGNIDPHFIDTLLDTVLQRMIDQAPVAYDEEQDSPYRWPEGIDLGFAPSAGSPLPLRWKVPRRGLSVTTRTICGDIGEWLRRMPRSRR
ncbi:hypothetical protein THH46_03630 [Pseudomonas sp. NA13]